jgi:hypothetical protein
VLSLLLGFGVIGGATSGGRGSISEQFPDFKSSLVESMQIVSFNVSFDTSICTDSMSSP